MPPRGYMLVVAKREDVLTSTYFDDIDADTTKVIN